MPSMYTNFIKQYASEHNLSYKQAMKEGSTHYQAYKAQLQSAKTPSQEKLSYTEPVEPLVELNLDMEVEPKPAPKKETTKQQE